MFKNLIPWKHQTDLALADHDSRKELAEFRENFDRLMNRFFQGDWDESRSQNWGCDVQDSENELIVRAEAPGFDPEEIDVHLSGDRLVIQAEHKTEEKTDGNGQYSHYGKFYRSMSVPSGIEADKIEANYKNGVLEVHLPKGEQARSKRISVAAK